MFFRSTAKSPMESPARNGTLDPLMNTAIENAEKLVLKYNSDLPQRKALFPENRGEGKKYLDSIKELQAAIQDCVADEFACERVVRAQSLIEMAMKRLEREFHQVLKSSRNLVDNIQESFSSRSSSSTIPEGEPERMGDSVSDRISDLKAIADCMIFCGYSKECHQIYVIHRKSVIDEAIYNFGVQEWTSSQVQRTEWKDLEITINQWINSAKIAVRSLFSNEISMHNHVFSSCSSSSRESCLTDITKTAAISIFAFPGKIAMRKKTLEKVFTTLSLYEAISDLMPEIESWFSFESTAAILTQAVNSLNKLAESIRSMVADFECAIEKENSKYFDPRGGIHPLTRYVMNFLVFLSDYSGVLAEIFSESSLKPPSPFPEAYVGNSCSDSDVATSSIVVKLNWLILVLLCKVDSKADQYNNVSLSYLFLANNLHYVVDKVRTSNLKTLIGEDWIAKHEKKAKQYFSNCERIGWSAVLEALPGLSIGHLQINEVEERFIRFNSAFEKTYGMQNRWAVADTKAKEHIKVAVAKKVLPSYKKFYEAYWEKVNRRIVQYAPDEVAHCLSGLFERIN